MSIIYYVALYCYFYLSVVVHVATWNMERRRTCMLLSNKMTSSTFFLHVYIYNYNGNVRKRNKKIWI